MAWFGGVVAFRAFGEEWLELSWEACLRATWVHMEVPRFLSVSCVPGGRRSEPFTQEAHRYQYLRCETLKSPFWKN